MKTPSGPNEKESAGVAARTIKHLYAYGNHTKKKKRSLRLFPKLPWLPTRKKETSFEGPYKREGGDRTRRADAATNYEYAKDDWASSKTNKACRHTIMSCHAHTVVCDRTFLLSLTGRCHDSSDDSIDSPEPARRAVLQSIGRLEQIKPITM